MVRYLDTIGPSVMNVICFVVPIVGFIVGLMKGFVDRSVRVIEGGIIIFLSLYLKNPISTLLYKFAPFFNMQYKVVNVLLYEFIAFVIIALIMVVIVYILNKFINFVSKVIGLIMSIGIPTPILGAFVSMAEYLFFLYVFIFIVFFFSNLTDSPVEASVANKIYYNMPVLRPIFAKPFDSCLDVAKSISSNESADKINYNSMKILLDNGFITYDNAKYIIETNKIKFANSKELLLK